VTISCGKPQTAIFLGPPSYTPKIYDGDSEIFIFTIYNGNPTETLFFLKISWDGTVIYAESPAQAWPNALAGTAQRQVTIPNWKGPKEYDLTAELYSSPSQTLQDITTFTVVVSGKLEVKYRGDVVQVAGGDYAIDVKEVLTPSGTLKAGDKTWVSVYGQGQVTGDVKVGSYVEVYGEQYSTTPGIHGYQINVYQSYHYIKLFSNIVVDILAPASGIAYFTSPGVVPFAVMPVVLSGPPVTAIKAIILRRDGTRTSIDLKKPTEGLRFLGTWETPVEGEYKFQLELLVGQDRQESSWYTFKVDKGEVIETAHFVMHYHQGFESAGKIYASSAESAWNIVGNELGYPSEQKTHVFVLATYEEMQSVTQGAAVFKQSTWDFLGVFFLGWEGLPKIFVPAPGVPIPPSKIPVYEDQDLPSLISHEFTHRIELHYTPQVFVVVPNWFKEGVAVYGDFLATYTRNRGTGAWWDKQLHAFLLAYETGALTDFEWFGESSFEKYGASFSFFKFVRDNFGKDKIGEIFRGFSDLKQLDILILKYTILQAIGFRGSWDNLKELWRKYVDMLAKGGQATGTIVELEDIQGKLYLHIYDPENRHVGINFETGNIELSIPGACYADFANMIVVYLPQTLSGFKYVVDGRQATSDAEDYKLTIASIEGGNIVTTAIDSGTVTKGKTAEHSVDISTDRKSITIDRPSLLISLSKNIHWLAAVTVGALGVFVVMMWRRRRTPRILEVTKRPSISYHDVFRVHLYFSHGMLLPSPKRISSIV